ncbi:heavy-metal-associated domain-containing protein [Streptomyces sp. AK08-02]|uniref:heavy-metal-associated domain-containing protein n=1 Tax=Streptomyces sp. AK08-02 TaxID=3028654 RepID=UPI0029B352AD|nr:heavy-metal-associated domain-containing protein [Streptomyces sp. AK08-02]MDX3746437.1 heavy-metal-associated domain-containing protein [Streptomyces sp. AK08-02]
MAERHYAVTGMSCEHCAASITEEVSEVSGVDEVLVDLATDTVTVRGSALDDGSIRHAIVEAGYTVAEPQAA